MENYIKSHDNDYWLAIKFKSLTIKSIIYISAVKRRDVIGRIHRWLMTIARDIDIVKTIHIAWINIPL